MCIACARGAFEPNLSTLSLQGCSKLCIRDSGSAIRLQDFGFNEKQVPYQTTFFSRTFRSITTTTLRRPSSSPP
jgi:hypothetical protein